MGMFDNVKYEVPCPICGAPTRDWQTKDAGCALASLTPAQLWEQSAAVRAARKADAEPNSFGEHAKFYTNCDEGCGTRIEIQLSPGWFEYSSDELMKIFNGQHVASRSGPVIPSGLSGQVPTEEPR